MYVHTMYVHTNKMGEREDVTPHVRNIWMELKNKKNMIIFHKIDLCITFLIFLFL